MFVWKRILIAFLLFLIATGCVIFYITQPLFSIAFHKNRPKGDPARLEQSVRALVELGPRDAARIAILQKAEAWVEAQLRVSSTRVSVQEYKVKGQTYKNIRAFFGPDQGARIIIGAHFDACAGLPGADDNASGVAVLLELARLLAEYPPTTPVELVGWNLEEPPHFRTDEMGSRVHAQALRTSGEPVQFVVALETLGTYTDEPASQAYPIGLMKAFYPTRGNFLAAVGNWAEAGLMRTLKSRMMASTRLPIRSITAPAFIRGVDFSDHASYWKEGIPAIMLTDTAFYRNPRYHTAEDTPDRLNYERLAEVVQAAYALILNAAETGMDS